MGSVTDKVVSYESGVAPSKTKLPFNCVVLSGRNSATDVGVCKVEPLLPVATDVKIATFPPSALLVPLPPYKNKFPPALSVPVASPPLIYKPPPASSVCLNLLTVAKPLSSSPIYKVSESYTNPDSDVTVPSPSSVSN